MVHDLKRGEVTDGQDIEYGVSKLRGARWRECVWDRRASEIRRCTN